MSLGRDRLARDLRAIAIVLSLAIVQPGQTRVVLFFGRYVGIVRGPGRSWVPPLTVRRNGSVRVQAESALRHVATSHPSDAGTSLRGSTDVVAAELAREVAERVAIASVEIVEVRISHLAYPAEIAQAMLRRQQANAVVAPRSRIVEGAVGMVEMARVHLAQLGEHGVVDLDEERKAWMVSNGRGQHRLALLVTQDRKRVLLRSTPPFTTRRSGGPPTSSAASPRTSRCCCARRRGRPAGCRGRPVRSPGGAGRRGVTADVAALGAT